MIPLGWYPPLRRFAPDAIVVPDGVNPVTRRAMEWAHRQGLRVVTLHAEGAITPPLEALWAGVGLDASLEDAVIVWGERGKAILTRVGRDPDRIHVCGNPRFDKYFRPLPSKADLCARLGWDPRRPLVFYAANLQWVRGVDYADRDYSFLPDPHRTVGRLVDLRYRTNEAVYALVERRPDVNFLVKPHPSDDAPQEYVEEARRRGAPNLRVVHTEYDVADLLPACDVLLHWNTTASTEAWFLDKPTIAIHLDPALDFFLSDFATGSDLVRSPEDLGARLAHYLGGGEVPAPVRRERERFIREWYGPVDGQSVARCADAIEATLRRVPAQPRRRRTWAEVKSTVIFAAKRALGRSPHERLLPFQRPYPDLPTPDEVTGWEERLREARGRARRRGPSG